MCVWEKYMCLHIGEQVAGQMCVCGDSELYAGCEFDSQSGWDSCEVKVCRRGYAPGATAAGFTFWHE